MITHAYFSYNNLRTFLFEIRASLTKRLLNASDYSMFSQDYTCVGAIARV